MITCTPPLLLWMILQAYALTLSHGFQSAQTTTTLLHGSVMASAPEGSDIDEFETLLTTRFPTSVDDQVRQASEALRLSSRDGIHRHNIRLLLPLIGATELDDWPGGARQMMEAAFPFTERILKSLGAQSVSDSILDNSDGVRAILSQAEEAKDDACAVLLPSADTVTLLQGLETQVGPDRNLILVNSQWKRQSDFGFFGSLEQVEYVENFAPTFYCSNLMVEGEQVRILRCYPGPWRVFLRKEIEKDRFDWVQIGSRSVEDAKTETWKNDPINKKDGGRLYDYGQPSYREVEEMIISTEGYVPKSMPERAAAAFTFIKDTL